MHSSLLNTYNRDQNKLSRAFINKYFSDYIQSCSLESCVRKDTEGGEKNYEGNHWTSLTEEGFRLRTRKATEKSSNIEEKATDFLWTFEQTSTKSTSQKDTETLSIQHCGYVR